MSKEKKPTGKPGDDAYNILFILTDQERYFDPRLCTDQDAVFPGRARLKQRGVTFTNHNINSAVCTSSRSVIYTGQHIQFTGMYDNLGFDWSPRLNPEIATIGDMMTKAGYYPAYKGKWHLSEEMESGTGEAEEGEASSQYRSLPNEYYTELMKEYGFNDYVGIGDVIGTADGGYLNDDMTGAQAIRWMRSIGMSLNKKEKQPWFLAVNLVNPHDVMYLNTDTPGDIEQSDPKPMKVISPRPQTQQYDMKWTEQILPPTTSGDSIEDKNRLNAHKEYNDVMKAAIGDYTKNEVRLGRLHNFYINSIRQTDRVLESILDALEDLKILDKTIIVMTADHGELGGAHQLVGKGATAYKEQNHVPLIVSHPDFPKTFDQTRDAVTSHLDLVPSMLNWALENQGRTHKNITDALAPKMIIQDLKGKDLTPQLEGKDSNACARDSRLRQEAGVLYCFNMLSYMDGEYALGLQESINNKTAAEFSQNNEIDTDKRGSIRTIFDGRYKYSRYFKPAHHNQPETVEEALLKNDIELFAINPEPGRFYGIQADWDESINLALDITRDSEAWQLLEEMNARMNALIQAEIGEDNGEFMELDDTERTRPAPVEFDL